MNSILIAISKICAENDMKLHDAYLAMICSSDGRVLSLVDISNYELNISAANLFYDRDMYYVTHGIAFAGFSGRSSKEVKTKNGCSNHIVHLITDHEFGLWDRSISLSDPGSDVEGFIRTCVLLSKSNWVRFQSELRESTL